MLLPSTRQPMIRARFSVISLFLRGLNGFVGDVVVEQLGQLATGTVVVSFPKWKAREKLALNLRHRSEAPLSPTWGLC
jgi:hypothetical protein